MGEYQDAAAVALFAHPDMVASIPRIYPAHGAAPEPVLLSGAWSAAEAGAALSWTPAGPEGFSRYQVRCRAGSEAPAATDELIATVTDVEHTTLLATGMYTPEQGEFSFRVWVVTTSDRVAASNAVTVARPA